MKRKSTILSVLAALAVFTAVAAEPDYSDGIIVVNEDWYGHRNSTVNFLKPDAENGEYWQYRIIQTENPGMELGCTNQYGAVWNGRLYLIAKQEKDPGANITGGRITVADARSMKIIRQLHLIDPSGAQCDGRAFTGVSAGKGYVSTSNGIWILDLNTLEITGQIEGSANPNTSDGKPANDPTASLYHGQTGTMILAEGKVFAVHQEYGMLVIDTALDKVTDVLDMTIIDDIIEEDTGSRPKRSAGIGSAIVKSKDGNLWYGASKDTQGTGSAVPYIIRLNPKTLEREVIRINGDGIYPPGNSWYAWTPDAFCASAINNVLYWCGGNNSWFSNYRVFRFDIGSRTITKILDFTGQEGNWHIYGCSLGIHPSTDELYASLFHQFQDPTYETRRYDSNGTLLQSYPMISDYWFPSMFVFPTDSGPDSVEVSTEPVPCSAVCIAYRNDILSISGAGNEEYATVFSLQGLMEAVIPLDEGHADIPLALPHGIHIVKIGKSVFKIISQ